MEPSNFDESNGVIGPPEGVSEGECGSLHCWRGTYDESGVRVIITRWKPTIDEVEAMLNGEPVWLHCVGGMPPVVLTTEYPFEKPK